MIFLPALVSQMLGCQVGTATSGLEMTFLKKKIGEINLKWGCQSGPQCSLTRVLTKRRVWVYFITVAMLVMEPKLAPLSKRSAMPFILRWDLTDLFSLPLELWSSYLLHS